MSMRPPRSAFTLIELLIVITILIIILGAIFVFVDPVRRFNMTRNAVRRADSEAIAKAVSLALTDAEQEVPPHIGIIDRKWRMIGKADRGCNLACGDLGQSDHSVYLDGNGSGAIVNDTSIGNIPPNSAISFSFWVKPNSSGGLIFQKIGTTKGYSVLLGEASPRELHVFFAGYDADGISGVTNNSAIPVGQYTHIFLEFQNSPPQAHIYVNGKDDTASLWGNGLDAIESAVPLRIGGKFNGRIFSTMVQIQALKGYIDDFRIYKGFLGPSDIMEISHGGEHRYSTSPNASLIAHWTFDEPPSNGFFEDVSDNNYGLDQERLIVSDDVPRTPAVHYELPDHCIDLQQELVSLGTLPKLPVNPATDEIEASDNITYYAIRSTDGLISVRSCLSEGEERQGAGQGPSIEVSR
jgi:type II secretory pathway pseudopilin PulG